MFRHRRWSFQEWLDQLDVIIALVIAIICGVLGLLSYIPLSALEASILTVLAIIAVAQVRDRVVRDKVSRRLDQLESNVVLDNFFRRDTDEKPLLQNADDEIWLVRQTGNFTFDIDLELLKRFLRRNEKGRIRIVLTAPTDPMLNQVALRNNLPSDRIKRSFYWSQKRVDDIRDEIVTRRLEVRFTPYPTQMNSIFVDPHHSDSEKSQAVIRYIGYNENVDDLRDMLDFSLRADLGPGVFSYYFGEAKKIFLRSSKVVVLIGGPKSGKTKMMQDLVNSVPETDRDKLVFSVLSPRNTNGEFEVIVNGKSVGTIVEQQNGKDDAKLRVLKEVAGELKKASRKILIVDDVRSYHLKCQEFIGTIRDLVHDPTVTLFLSITREERRHPDYKDLHSFTSEIELNYRTTILDEELGSKEQKQRLKEELEASLLLAKHVPLTNWKILTDAH